MLKAFKYRIYPTKEQEKKIVQHIGGCRFVYNWALENKIRYYETSKEKLSAYDLNYMLKGLKAENHWLKEVNSQSLQQTNKNMESAFTRFFREKKGFPKFKSKKNPVQSFQIPQHYTIDFEKQLIKLPKIGNVKIVISRTFEGTPKTATVSRTPTGKYFISILVDDGKEIPEKQPFDENSTVGVDLGIKDSAILSNGEKFENPKYLKNSLQKLKVLSKKLSKKVKGSNNWKKAKLKLSRLHEKISNQRNDFQHKLSSRLISENQAIALETLNVKGMIKNHCLAQSISDAGWSSFVTKLEYKAEWAGKTILRIGTFEPSSKICNVCGYYKSDLTLKTREWICPDCKTKHDRDINAAINIKKFALQSQNLISP
ncbi:MAG: IS200/IS605 family element RNA-guided endonuclease TnpB [Proteiniphilum sp.]|nr:IS200/IS605 family element RNA-guided endonuclease TnpB [Proteiniphilum sp.]